MKSNSPLATLLLVQIGFAWLCCNAFAANQLGDLTGPWILFVDDQPPVQKENVTRIYQPFTKHDQNPVMVADKPWEGSIG